MGRTLPNRDDPVPGREYEGLQAGVDSKLGRERGHLVEDRRCPQAAAPHWWASANTWVPACPTGRVFDATSSTCQWAGRPCCACRGGSKPFCSYAYATSDDCFDACDVLNPKVSRRHTTEGRTLAP